METISKLLSVTVAATVAACFLCSAAFLFGQLYGAHRTDLLWYLTFSDFVNFAPATLLAYFFAFAAFGFGDYVLGTLFNRYQHRLVPKDKSTFPLAATIIAVLMLAAPVAVILYLLPWENALALIPLLIVVGTATNAARPHIIRTSNEKVAIAFGSFATVIIVALIYGDYRGLTGVRDGPTYQIKTQLSVRHGHLLMPFERGLAVIENNGFELIPWQEVKGVALVDSPLKESVTGSVGRGHQIIGSVCRRIPRPIPCAI